MGTLTQLGLRGDAGSGVSDRLTLAGLDSMLEEENCKRRRLRSDYETAMSHAKEKFHLHKQLTESKLHVCKLTADIKRIDAVVAALTSRKVFDPEMLGQGRSQGGLREHRQNRFDVLERVRRIGNLTADQTLQWEFFKTQWDYDQAAEHGVDWGGIFAQSIQGILHKFLDGEDDAFSKFVKKETDRVLGDPDGLVVAGDQTSAVSAGSSSG